MKALNLKKVKLLYVNLIAVAILIPSLGGIVGGLNAQTVDIFLNSQWFLADSEINGVSISISDLGGATFESPPNGNSFLFIYGNSCFEYITVPYSNVTNNSFILDPIVYYIQCNYTDPDEIDAVDLHNSFYFQLPINSNGTPNNPFGYGFVNNGNPVLDLLITNPNGDWVLYTREYLSLSDFSKDSFRLYPNPVQETLQVYNTSSQPVTATVYGLNGKLLQRHHLGTSTSTIDVKALNPSLYFMVFESEAGERVSKKFVKN